jgi:hypothetical protein
VIYRHQNNKPYLKLLSIKVKIDNEWVDAILYMCLYYNRAGMFWVRTKQDFNNKFKRVKIFS